MRHHPLRALGTSIVLMALLMSVTAGCGDDADEAAETTAPATENALFDMLPERIRESGEISIATGASYPPDQYMLEDGTIVGWSVDILHEIGAKLGVEMKIENLDFPGILPAIEGGRYDIGSSSYAVTEERLGAVDFVIYYQNGQFIAVATGNPNGVDPEAICGLRFAVTTGSLSNITAEALSQECVDAGEPAIDILEFPNASAVYLAIAADRADVTVVNASTLGNLPEDIEAIGESFRPSTVGFIFNKQETELRDAVYAALEAMIEDGSYIAILEEWGIEEGAVANSEVRS